MPKPKPQPGLPNQAQLMFSGKIFEIWQWEQLMFDGSTQIFEKAWRLPGAEIIATTENKIIIEDLNQPDQQNIISLPSGRSEEGEDLLSTAQRELLEETGYTSRDWTEIMTLRQEPKVIHEVKIFIARGCQKTHAQHLDPGEQISTRLISFEEFLLLTEEPRFLMYPEFINFLLRLQTDSRRQAEFRQLLFPNKTS